MESTKLFIRLKEYGRYASTAEKNVVDFILDHPQEVMGKTVHELASITYTSASTIVRFCRKMGFHGYKEFQQGLVYEFAMSQGSVNVALQDISPRDSTTDVIRKVTQKNVDSLRITEKLLNSETIDACVQLLSQSRVINLFGIGASLLAAKDLQLKLLRVDKFCNMSDDWHSQFLYAKNMGPDDVAVIISYSGLTREMITCAKAAKKNGAKVIAITRGDSNSELIKYANYTLGVGSTEFIVRSGAMSSRLSQLNVIDILYAAYINQNYEQCMKKFVKNYIEKENELQNER